VETNRCIAWSGSGGFAKNEKTPIIPATAKHKQLLFGKVCIFHFTESVFCCEWNSHCRRLTDKDAGPVNHTKWALFIVFRIVLQGHFAEVGWVISYRRQEAVIATSLESGGSNLRF
jgi:hypothetical protein